MIAAERLDPSAVRPFLVSALRGAGYSGGPVVIKPNLGGREPIVAGENTSASLTAELVRAIREVSADTILIAHGSLLDPGGGRVGFEEVVRASGYQRLAAEAGVQLVNLDNCQRELVNLAGLVVRVPRLVRDCFYMNVAKFKTHMETTVSLCMKNQMGLLDHCSLMRMHKAGLHGPISQLALALRPNLNILDGMPGLEGNGPHHGRPKHAGLMVAGTDMVETDSLACFLMGLSPSSVSHIILAARAGAGGAAPQAVLDRYAGLRARFKPPSSVFRAGPSGRVFPTTACSLCVQALERAFERGPHRVSRVRAALLTSTHKADVVLGRGDGVDVSKLRSPYVIGDCAQRFASEAGLALLAGCPPAVEEIVGLFASKPLVSLLHRQRRPV